MSTRCTLAIFEDDHFQAHLYEEMHDGAAHLEINLKCAPDTLSHSYMNIIIGKDWIRPLMNLMKKSG